MTLANQDTPVSQATRIERSINRDVAGTIRASSALGGLQFANMGEVLEFAKLMAVSDIGVPKHLRGNAGACLAVCTQALEWRMSPFAVANKSYIVNDRISYESQLLHAVVEQRAPLIGRLRCRYTGEGDSRRCIVYATIKGETEPFEYQSSPFSSIQPKNSPLWKTKPDLQLFYNASRDWARMYFPDVILGVYAEDELLDSPEIVEPVKQLDDRIATAKAKRADTNKPAEVVEPILPADGAAPAQRSASGAADDHVASDGTKADSDVERHEENPNDADQRTFPPCPEKAMAQDVFIDLVAGLCGIEMGDTEKALKLVWPKPTWASATSLYQKDWWGKFAQGKFPGLTPKIENA